MALEKIDKYYSPELVTDLVNKAKGHSTFAALSKQEPMAFVGNKEFVFSMDNELDIVAENGKMSHGGITLSPVIMQPIKFEYGARISDEFLQASMEEKVKILEAFNEGFARKMGRALDIASFHGVNPRTGEVSTLIGDNCFDKKVSQTVVYSATEINDNIEAAVELVEGSEGEINGLALSTQARSALAKLKNGNGGRLFPELTWGGAPGVLNGLPTDVNTTVNNTNMKDRAIIGDWQNMAKWGYGKEIRFKIIEYGDPDNSGNDLQGCGQIYLRCEVYLGWGIMDGNAFARVVERVVES